MGPSGCGKSTLLHLLGGLERPRGGAVAPTADVIGQLSERALAHLRRKEVGFVFQAFHLMDELTRPGERGVAVPLGGTLPRAARRRAAELLEQVGLADRAEFLPSALSGGQRQRVAIARALVNEPMIVLADEPTGNLDSAATVEVLRLFDTLHESGQTLVIVTHDQRIAATADRLISMRDGAFVDETRMTGGSAGTLERSSGWTAEPVSRAFLVFRLAVRDIRHRPGEAAMLMVVIMAATTALTVGLVLHGVTAEPYQVTRDATAGPDVLATEFPSGSGPSADHAALTQIAPLFMRAVWSAHSGPFPSPSPCSPSTDTPTRCWPRVATAPRPPSTSQR